MNWAADFFQNLEKFQDSFETFVQKNGGPCNDPIKIAILDTGVDKGSVGIDFDGKHMRDEWCFSFVGSHKDVHDTNGHGTHCASLLRKVAPNANIYVLKVFSTEEFDIQEAQNISKVLPTRVTYWLIQGSEHGPMADLHNHPPGNVYEY